MIEQAMIFALGVCVAGLLALLCLPAISRRALRMAQTVVERQMPISVDEIVAQRDLLRAEFAIERRQLEQTVEAAREAQAREMSESGRRAGEIGRLSGDLATVTAGRDAALAAEALAERERRETAAENAAMQKQLYDAEGMETRLRDGLETLRRDHATLTATHAAKADDFATLQQSHDALGTARDELDRSLGELRLELSIALARIETLAAQVDNGEEALRAASIRESELREKLATAERDGIDSGDIAMLRQTIVEIGNEVVRMAAATGAKTPPVDGPPSIAERETSRRSASVAN